MVAGSTALPGDLSCWMRPRSYRSALHETARQNCESKSGTFLSRNECARAPPHDQEKFRIRRYGFDGNGNGLVLVRQTYGALVRSDRYGHGTGAYTASAKNRRAADWDSFSHPRNRGTDVRHASTGNRRVSPE
ncbi:hypothetical protein D3C85_1426970 [compost metagenome]